MARAVPQPDAGSSHSCGFDAISSSSGRLKEDSAYMDRFARGHLLALKLAASAALEHSGFNLKETGVQNAVKI
jgi:hypothetical protein